MKKLIIGAVATVFLFTVWAGKAESDALKEAVEFTRNTSFQAKSAKKFDSYQIPMRFSQYVDASTGEIFQRQDTMSGENSMQHIILSPDGYFLCVKDAAAKQSYESLDWPPELPFNSLSSCNVVAAPTVFNGTNFIHYTVNNNSKTEEANMATYLVGKETPFIYKWSVYNSQNQEIASGFFDDVNFNPVFSDDFFTPPEKIVESDNEEDLVILLETQSRTPSGTFFRKSLSIGYWAIGALLVFLVIVFIIKASKK